MLFSNDTVLGDNTNVDKCKVETREALESKDGVCVCVCVCVCVFE